jgi:Asp-tRNA(Asn)/Glu-tRNA(Gln) amidotransferase A subunit family amidase
VTRGSPIFRNDRPTADSVLVERLRQAGVVPIGKTNTPGFGMGSHTYNRVYGTTVNPYDLTKSAGGSSGGAAASVASGMLPAVDGSDLGGSLRNPGNFNNVVGFRPTVGLVPTSPTRCRCLDSRLRDQLPVPCRTLATYLPRWRGLILGIQAVPRRIRLCSRGPLSAASRTCA